MRRKWIPLMLFVLLLSGCQPPQSESEIGTVASKPTSTNSPTTAPEKKPLVVTSNANKAPGSLREALQEAQSGDVIIFDTTIFPPDDPATIYVIGEELPPITAGNLTLDASNAGVIIDGELLEGEWIAGLQIVDSSGNQIKGIQVTNFPGPGISISGESNQNIIGGDRNIGKGPWGQGNLLSNNNVGISITLPGARFNIVTGNLIGVDLERSEGLGNESFGVHVWEGASNNTIGPDNIIAHNGNDGIYFDPEVSDQNTAIDNDIFSNMVMIKTDDTDAPSSTEAAATTITPSTAVTLAPLESAEIIFFNGIIITMEESQPQVEAIALQNGLIQALGTNQEILSLQGSATKMVDLQGKTVLPGFVDPHTHILNSAGTHMGLNLDEAQDLALKNGITTLGNMYVNERFLQELKSLESAGNLRVRTNAYLVITNNCGEPLGDWYTDYPPSDEFGEMLRIGGVKLFLDGGTCGPVAVSEAILPGGELGTLFLSDEDLADILERADRNGYQIAIHALGDRAVDQAINALNGIIDSPENPERHRIEHVLFMVDGQYSRFSEMGIHPVIFGYWFTCSDDGTGYTESWKNNIRRWRKLVNANPDLIIATKTDTPWYGPPSPLLELYSLVTLREVAEDGSICTPPEWQADRTLTVDESLPMLTINAAYMLFREDEVGSLKPGKLADLIVLSGNPLENPNAIKDLSVLVTVVGGITEYCAEGQQAFCP